MLVVADNRHSSLAVFLHRLYDAQFHLKTFQLVHMENGRMERKKCAWTQQSMAKMVVKTPSTGKSTIVSKCFTIQTIQRKKLKLLKICSALH